MVQVKDVSHDMKAKGSRKISVYPAERPRVSELGSLGTFDEFFALIDRLEDLELRLASSTRPLMRPCSGTLPSTELDR